MRRSTLLLVEDSKEVLEDNRKALVAAGYEVLAASTLAGAREQLARRQPDLILLDVLLPDGNGVELCRGAAGFHRRAHFVPHQPGGERTDCGGPAGRRR